MPPAARKGDLHSCPAVTAGVPHVGGPIKDGAGDVLVVGMAAARQSDGCQCKLSGNTIAQGLGSVLICGKPAARLGDKCAHGGAVTEGAGSVVIG